MYAYVRNFVSISVYSVGLCWRKNPIFTVFLDFGILWCRQLASVWQSWTRVNDYKLSLIQWHQNCFCTPTPSWRNRAHKLWHSKAWRTSRQTDRQTDRQTKNSTFLVPGSGWNPSPTKLGMVIEDFMRVPAPLKLLGSDAVSPVGGAENVVETTPPQLKTHKTP